ncbi:hypothetical protein FBQ82_04200 [Anaerolineae bacterium CFX7]|nr:hypothetical protein [Anaerolineae bacterium CFX7]
MTNLFVQTRATIEIVTTRHLFSSATCRFFAMGIHRRNHLGLVGAIIAIAAALYGTGALVLTGWNRFSARRAKPNALSETPA